MTLNDDDVVAWTFNGQRTSCTVRIARLMLAAAHQDWSDERIEQELLVRKLSPSVVKRPPSIASLAVSRQVPPSAAIARARRRAARTATS